MYISANDLCSCQIVFDQGDDQSVSDVYVDIDRWKIRYLIVGMKDGTSRAVSPILLQRPIQKIRSGTRFSTKYSMEELERAPPLYKSQNSITRSLENDYLSHARIPRYWTELPGSWVEQPYSCANGVPDLRIRGQGFYFVSKHGSLNRDTRVYSLRFLRMFMARAGNESFGEVVDLVLDEQTWDIEYFVIKGTHEIYHVVIPSEAFSLFDLDRKEINFNVNLDRLPHLEKYDGVRSLSSDVLNIEAFSLE